MVAENDDDDDDDDAILLVKLKVESGGVATRKVLLYGSVDPLLGC